MHYMKGESDAVDNLKMMAVSAGGLNITDAIMAAAYGQLGRTDQARERVENLLSPCPEYEREFYEDVRARKLSRRHHRKPCRWPAQGGAGRARRLT